MIMKDIVILEYDYETANAKVLQFITPNGEKYAVEGECNRCGQCCISRCNHLLKETLDNKEIYTCTIHQLRPILCAIWPTSIEDLEGSPNCSYKLRKIE